MYKPADHTFAVCAYGESPFLEDCLKALSAQTQRTRVLIATSTPSPWLEEMARRFGVPLYVNQGESGIGADWNFAYACADTPLVTITHQDDLYHPEYAQRVLEDLNRSRNPILWFCDYEELRNARFVRDNRNLRIKRLLLFPLKWRLLQSSIFVRRRILSLGSPICCPSVTYVRERAGENPFSTTMKVSLDWDEWERQSKKKGAFVYRPECLLAHRVHEGSETTKMIESNRRGEEDLVMFRRFWPEKIARWLEKRYSTSEQSNAVNASD